ncbi:MAG: ribosomal-processing cysteine protease Prp [Eubacteriales bacterium]
MTYARFYLKHGVYTGFAIRGHSGFAGAGEDIVCAAVSAMTSLAVTFLEETGQEFEFFTDKKSGRVSLALSSPNNITQACCNGLYREIKALSGEYPENVKAVKRKVQAE